MPSKNLPLAIKRNPSLRSARNQKGHTIEKHQNNTKKTPLHPSLPTKNRSTNRCPINRCQGASLSPATTRRAPCPSWYCPPRSVPRNAPVAWERSAAGLRFSAKKHLPGVQLVGVAWLLNIMILASQKALLLKARVVLCVLFLC